MMKLSFFGAAHQVTGSCYMLEVGGKKVLIDCGMEQGPQIFEQQAFAMAPSDVYCVFLTHAHIDHSGLLPLLTKLGFDGKIYTTSATKNLCDIMLRDAAHIQESEAEWKNRKGQRAKNEPYEPLYTIEDAEECMKHFVGFEYGKEEVIDENISVRFLDAGHLLGSAHIEIVAKEGNQTRKIVFSGDIGNVGVPLLNHYTPIEDADYVVMESTYGDRDHEEVLDPVKDFAKIIQETFDKGGNVVIPCFAVGRTQELLYYLRQIKEEELVTGHNGYKIFLDSPLAINATNIFLDMGKEYYNDEADALISKGINPIGVKDLHYSITSEDSKMINEEVSPCIIISASGMCEAGRIRHHLKHNLWKPNSTILFVGFQVPGTLGHSILTGARKVTLFQETIAVDAQIKKLQNISAHAGRSDLLGFLSHLKTAPNHVFITHGDDRVSEMFAEKVHDTYGFKSTAPYYGEVYDLLNGEKIQNGHKKVRKEKKVATRKMGAYDKVLEALERLQNVAAKNQGKANHYLEKLAKQIDEISNRWD